jgi:hypothetical protein
LHSIEQGLPATRGGATSRDGAISSPARSNSESPRTSGAEVSFICSRSSHVTRFHTNSRRSPAKVAESLAPVLEKASMCGPSATALKKLYGARLTRPAESIVDIQPIGRGTTSALNGSCGSRARSRLAGS